MKTEADRDPRFLTNAIAPRLAHQFAVRRAIVTHLTSLVAVFWLLRLCHVSVAQQIWEENPYDVLVLNEAHGSVELKIFPFEGRQVEGDAQQPSSGSIRVRLLDRPDDEFDVAWKDIARIDRFPEVVLQEAQRLSEAGNFTAAFDAFAFLRREFPEHEGFADAYGAFLLRNALDAYAKGAWEDSLLHLKEAQNWVQDRPGLLSALDRVHDKLLTSLIRQRKFAEIRRYLDIHVDPATDNQLRLKWENALRDVASRQLNAAQKSVNAGRHREALEVVRRVLQFSPSAQGKQLASEIVRQYPTFVVGVTETSLAMNPQRLHDWGGRRRGRLRQRMIMEYLRIGSEGGTYHCPLGEFQISADGLRGTIRFRDLGLDNGQYVGYTAARTLFQLADSDAENFVPGWRRLLDNIRVRQLTDLELTFRSRPVKAESHLRIPLAGRGPFTALSAYAVEAGESEFQTEFVLNEQYALRVETQPAHISERYFVRSVDSIRALQDGQLDVIDRLFPGDVSLVRADDQIAVKPFGLPSVHFLVPNGRSPYAADRVFRRALIYGIDRQSILHRDILGGQQLEGCRILSGPLPTGISQGDPLGYGYDESITPRPFEPRLAYVLLETALQRVRANWEADSIELDETPSVHLVYPAANVARAASQRIAAHLSALGLRCRATELPRGQTLPSNDDWDLLYADVQIQEPITDIPRLFGQHGIFALEGPFVLRAVESLSQADNWSLARQLLMHFHLRVAEDLSVLPLWQINDHLAHRRGVSGIGDRPISLYDQIEQWRHEGAE